ncbi:hypothetical protein BU17DRAFT_62411 [Hysterangium stoloniferum]|nr:hypothetical protein BU17DRAFT_62411 [Hysterangium stoloniferum]
MDSLDSPSVPLAGPSSLPPTIFPAPQPFPRPKQHLHSTQDLLSVFNLHPAYDKYVRPHVRPLLEPDSIKGKGKGKEVLPSPLINHERDVEEEGGGGEKKKKRESYKHLIKRAPGKHSMKKDTYFQTLMGAPPKQKAQIHTLDLKTLREGFHVTPTGLPTYNKATLEGTDPKEKEAKRLKRERRKAEKEERQRVLLQQQAHASGSSVSTPRVVSTPRAAGTPGQPARNVSATPTAKAKPPASARASPHPGTPKAAGQRAELTPNPSVTTTRTTPTSTHPGRPAQTNGIVTPGSEKRGVKRGLDSESQQPPTPGPAIARPQKKRRIGSGTPQSTPLQQPTPHGS